MEKQTLVICISGGLDSFTMFHYANKVFNKDNKYNVKYLIVVDKDSPYWEKEWGVILELYAKNTPTLSTQFNLVMLQGYGRLAKTDDHVILGRNAMIASIASAIGENIWIGGTLFEDNIGMYDKNSYFWHDISQALTQACGYKRSKTIVYSPFQQTGKYWDKHDMIIWLESQGIHDWRQTVSCFHPTYMRCGLCAVCYKRYIYQKYVELTTDIRISDIPLEETYVNNPLDNFFLKDTIEKMKEAIKDNNFNRYHKERIQIYSKVLEFTGVISKGDLL